MNFWLLAFAIDYPPEIKRPELQKQATGAFTNRNRGLLSQNGKHFLHKSLPFISRASRVFGRLCMAEGSRRRTLDAGQHRPAESRPRFKLADSTSPRLALRQR